MRKAGKILLIDDNAEILLFLETILQDYSTQTAENGEKGVDIFVEWDPDLVILDYDMPKMNGLELMKEINRQDNLLPVLVLTGKESVALASAFMRAGALDFIVKPIDTDLLRTRVDWALNTYIPDQIRSLNEKIRTQRDEELRKWSSMVRHRVNNLLQVISFSLEEIEDQVKQAKIQPDNLKNIRRSMEEISKIMEHLHTVQFE